MQGHLELNVFKPLIGANLLRSIDLLATGMESFAERSVEGIEANEGRIAELFDRSLLLVTALEPEIGYDKTEHIAIQAHDQGATIREVQLPPDFPHPATFHPQPR